MSTKLLFVDDEESILKLLKSRFAREGFIVETCQSAMEAREFLEKNFMPLVITDIKMPGMSGMDLLEHIKNTTPETEVILITGHGEKQLAIEALKKGASDYLEKPFDLEELLHSIQKSIQTITLRKEKEELLERLKIRVDRAENSLSKNQDFFDFKSPSMKPVQEWLHVLKRESHSTNAEDPSVLILGESGTGKEVFSRKIHDDSKVSKGAFVAINCANFTENLLESELFGHEKGAFTGAQNMKRGLLEVAQNGTLFLDEIGEMDLKLQARLLRVLQDKKFRRVGGTMDMDAKVRIVAATNQNLEQKIKSGGFREDLYHRLSKVVLTLPPLRERKDDLVIFSEKFAQKLFLVRGKKFPGFSNETKQQILSYSWPGNVRELLNLLERAALVWNHEGSVELSIDAKKVSPSATQEFSPTLDFSESKSLDYKELKKEWNNQFEKAFLQNLLDRFEGNISACSREAGVDRSNFIKLVKKHEMDVENYKKKAS